MASPMSPAADYGYIRTVMSQENFRDLDSSTLAIPSEEKLKCSARHDREKSIRIQQQIQLTMARRKNKSSTSGGTFIRSTSVPEQVYYTQNIVENDYKSLPTQTSDFYESLKEYSSHGHGNGWGGGGANVHNSYKITEEKSQGQPLMRREISPERYSETAISGYKGTTSASQRLQEIRKAALSATRYARSDNAGLNLQKGQQSTYRRPYRVGSQWNSMFVGSLPSSPSGPLGQTSGNSHSVEGLIKKEVYIPLTSTLGQVKTMVQSPAVAAIQQYARADWSQQTIKSSYVEQGSSRQASLVGAGFAEISGQKITRTVGMAAASGSGIFQTQQEDLQSGSEVWNSEVDLTLESAVRLLDNEASSTYWITSAANFIQHESFQKAESRRKVYSLGGIPKLLQLLHNENEEIQRAACAALRNLVFEDNDNKLEVYEQRGIPLLLTLLKQTRDLDTKKQITGLLWNLSSNDQLKIMLIRDALQTVTQNIIVPYSGWTEGDCPKIDAISDPDIFYNATGCLRNLSSAGPESRKQMRDCDGLIDSLVHYIRGTVADLTPNDKSTENCACILHNLSYQLELELPRSFTENIYTQRRNVLSQSSTNVGCFGARSGKIKEQQLDSLLPEEKSNPKGMEWLWHSIVMRMYLSLIAKSSRTYTQEAALGALQNLTAGSGPMPFAVAQMVVQKENGLQHIRNIMHSSDPRVKRATASLLRNLSRHISLQNEIAKSLLPDLVNFIPDSAPDNDNANDTAASICYTLNNLILNNSQNARTLLNNGGLKKVLNISVSDGTMSTKAGKASSTVLYSMWLHSDLQSAFKKIFKYQEYVGDTWNRELDLQVQAQFKKTDFVNSRTTKAFNSFKE